MDNNRHDFTFVLYLCIGDDRIGKIIIDILVKSGSAEGIKISPGEESSYTVVLAPPGIDRIFLHCNLIEYKG